MAVFGKSTFHDGLELKVNFSSTNTMTLDVAGEPTASWRLNLPANPPATASNLVVAADGSVTYQALGGGGTVTNFSAGDLTGLFTTTETTTTTTPALSFAFVNQPQKTMLMGPISGADAAPSFRTIAFTDVSGLGGNTATSFALGNDARLHTQNTDTGTTAASFQIDSGNGGPRVKNEAGSVALRNAADGAYVDLIVRNITVQGTTTTVNTETVDVADNIINLNSNVSTGTPTENLGLRGSRGSSTAASIIFNEAIDLWQAGLEGAEINLSRIRQGNFTNATLVAGVLTISHGLGNQYPDIAIFDNNNKRIRNVDGETATDGNTYSVDVSTFGTLTGTWKWTAIG